MPSFADALCEDEDGTIIAIEVTAGAKRESFPAGYNAWRRSIGCRVAAPALEGRANKAVIALVAEALGVAPSSVTIRSGATSSQKKVHVASMTIADVIACLERD